MNQEELEAENLAIAREAIVKAAKKTKITDMGAMIRQETVRMERHIMPFIARWRKQHPDADRDQLLLNASEEIKDYAFNGWRLNSTLDPRLPY